jgi:hypothetical protein
MQPAEARNLSSVVGDLQVIREQQGRWHDPQKENYNVKPGCEECPEELSRDTRGRRPVSVGSPAPRPSWLNPAPDPSASSVKALRFAAMNAKSQGSIC